MKILVVLSGGMDSATLLWLLKSQEHHVEAVTIDYKQRHIKEIDSAKSLCAMLGVKHDIIDLSSIGQYLTGSSQSDLSVDVPHGRYDEPSMKLTVVPNRNMLLLAAAGAVAIARKMDQVAYGAHSGDHAIYPDCRPAFVDSMRETFKLADWHQIDIATPFINIDKGRICNLGIDLGVPYHMTWTCYAGDELPCRKCGACVERAEAFAFAKATDPLIGTD